MTILAGCSPSSSETDVSSQKVVIALSMPTTTQEETTTIVGALDSALETVLERASDGSDLPGRAADRSFVAQASSLAATYGSRADS
ncbi:hypothetical protein NKG05_14855 [Oerskovia sp. M15]